MRKVFTSNTGSKKVVEPAKAVEPAKQAFVPDGEPLPDGSVRYKILCDGGIHPSGVFFSKTVPPGASIDDLKTVQAERDEALKRLKALLEAA